MVRPASADRSKVNVSSASAELSEVKVSDEPRISIYR